MKGVKNVEWWDLGMLEALWVFEVKEFGPLVIGIDSHGRNIFEEMNERVELNKQRVIK